MAAIAPTTRSVAGSRPLLAKTWLQPSPAQRQTFCSQEQVFLCAARLKREFQIPCGVSAISRILRQNGLTRRHKKKHHVKRDLRLVKAQYKPFTRLQMDVKYLTELLQPRSP
jgi:hypothetical protein